MSKHRVVVLRIVARQITVSAAAVEYGINRQHLHRLLKRYRDGGIDAVEPRSRAPRSNPNRTQPATVSRVIVLRQQLTGQGLDAGPITVAWHLEREGITAPSTSTIRRICMP